MQVDAESESESESPLSQLNSTRLVDRSSTCSDHHDAQVLCSSGQVVWEKMKESRLDNVMDGMVERDALTDSH